MAIVGIKYTTKYLYLLYFLRWLIIVIDLYRVYSPILDSRKLTAASLELNLSHREVDLRDGSY